MTLKQKTGFISIW